MSSATSLPYGLNDTAVRTTLAAGITSGATSFDVSEVTNAPSTPFLISVFVDQSPLREDQMEIMEVTSISGTTLTVNRGAKGTTAQSFSSGDKVFMGVVPSDGFDEVSSNFDVVEVTTATTKNLAGGVKAEVTLDARDLSGGSLALEVDGSDRTSGFSSGEETHVVNAGSTIDFRVDSPTHLISVDDTNSEIYKHSNVSETVTTKFSTPSTNARGLARDSNNNLISGDEGNLEVYIHSGVSSTVTSTFSSAGGSNPRGQAVDGSGNFVEVDATEENIYVHSGISGTVSNSFSAQSGTPQGLSVDPNDNLASASRNNSTIFIHSGISETISSSFSSPGGGSPSGLDHIDGDLISTNQGGTENIWRHSGNTSTITKSFSTPGSSPSGLGSVVGSILGAGRAAINHL